MKTPTGGVLGFLLLAACASPPSGVRQKAAPMQCAPVTATVYFAPNSSDILDSSGPVLSRFTRKVETCSKAPDAGLSIQVSGYPDQKDTGQEADMLANARAEAVRLKLIGSGMPPTKIVLLPRTPSNSDKDRIMRRRVKIVASFIQGPPKR